MLASSCVDICKNWWKKRWRFGQKIEEDFVEAREKTWWRMSLNYLSREDHPWRWSNQIEVNNSRWLEVITLLSSPDLTDSMRVGIYALLIALAFHCDTWREEWRDARPSVVTKLTQRHQATRMSGTKPASVSQSESRHMLISLISTSTWSDQKCHHHYPQDRPAELSGQSPPSVPRFCPVIVHPGHHHSHHRCHPPFRTFGGKTQGIIILCYMVVPVIVHPEHHVSHHEYHPKFRTEHHNLMVITTIVHHDHHVSYHKYHGTAKEYQMSTLMCYHEDNRAFLLLFSRWLEKFNVGVLSSRVGKNRCMLFSAADHCQYVLFRVCIKGFNTPKTITNDFDNLTKQRTSSLQGKWNLVWQGWARVSGNLQLSLTASKLVSTNCFSVATRWCICLHWPYLMHSQYTFFCKSVDHWICFFVDLS